MKNKIIMFILKNVLSITLFIVWVIYIIYSFSESGVIMPSYKFNTSHFIFGSVWVAFALYGVYNFIKNFREYL